MPVIYLLRHAATTGNMEKRYIGKTDEPLCREGIAAAEKKRLPPVSAVFTSPLQRCIQTAGIVYPDSKYDVIDDLRETDLGLFENKSYRELNGNEAYQRWIDSGGKAEFPGGESFIEAGRRAVRAWETVVKICQKQHIETAAVITHGGTIMAVMEWLLPGEREYYGWQVGNCEGYEIEWIGGRLCFRSC